MSPNLSPVDMASLAAAMRMGNNGDMSGGAQGSTGPQQQGVQATGPEQTLRMHQAEALLRSQAEAALRLAVSTLSSSRFSPIFFFFFFVVVVVVVVVVDRIKWTYVPPATILGVAGGSGGSQFRGWW